MSVSAKHAVTVKSMSFRIEKQAEVAKPGQRREVQVLIS